MSEHIKKHWDGQAEKDSYKASWEDIYAINLEINAIGNFINDKDIVLDVGCANGYSTSRQKGKKITGVDFSEAMITVATKLKSKRLHFTVGDIRNLQFESKSFDIVYTTRCLINLPTWEEQKQGISECLRVASKKVILSEGFYESFIKLNALRLIAGLSPLVEHDYNRYLKKERLNDLLKGYKFKNYDFSSLYYLGTRFIRELTNVDSLEYTNKLNNEFYKLQKEYKCEGFGIQQLYVIDL